VGLSDLSKLFAPEPQRGERGEEGVKMALADVQQKIFPKIQAPPEWGIEPVPRIISQHKWDELGRHRTVWDRLWRISSC
jgi:hypothetical protein